ncbi:hypothetical protein [Intrasporangium sp.]|uniref:hypothetical protein n=1 Tax=Intrasporangium sp. TaxID=1925024 RepID=UPI003221E156
MHVQHSSRAVVAPRGDLSGGLATEHAPGGMGAGNHNAIHRARLDGRRGTPAPAFATLAPDLQEVFA